MSMNKRVYGVLGVSSVMSNWNADFSGYPKTTSDGTVFGSDKAFKYPIKKMWQNDGEKVLYIKTMHFESKKGGEEAFLPRTLKEQYETVFQVEDLKKQNNTKEVLKNLFQAIDVKNFGATFAEAEKNISITGAVQIGQGMNKYEDTYVQEQQILSPFKDGSEKKKDAKNSTLGTKIVTDEAHYFYPFVINPLAYKEFIELDVTEGYTEEDYKKFKEASICATTSYATNSKIGCENEFGLFVETDIDMYLPNLSTYIEFKKGNGGEKNKIIITCDELINSMKEKIKLVEVYYNPYTTEIDTNIEGVRFYNIITQKEV